MGSSDSKLSAQAQAQQEEQYAHQMKNPAVVAAIEALETCDFAVVDKPITGLKFYQLFAAMDKEYENMNSVPSQSADFALYIDHNLGKQTPARGVTFDDFVLNLWNFCTMSPQDIYTHVFRLYGIHFAADLNKVAVLTTSFLCFTPDDDHNGTLDAAECESLFRLLYHTDNLPSIVKNQLKSMTSNDSGAITLGSYAFLVMCSSKANLFKPIIDLQTRARTKVEAVIMSLGVGYWSNASKKRVKILSGDKDVFDIAASRLQASRGQPSSASSRTNILSGGPVRKLSSSSVSSLIATDPSSPKVPEDNPPKANPVDNKSLDAWVQAEATKEPLVQAYLTAFSQAYVAECHLKEQSQKASTGPGQDQLLLDLRYTVAVSSKRRDEAKSALEELWEQEQSSLIAERHDVSADKVVRSYTQKKLDIEESSIRNRFSGRWQALERAAELVGQRDLEAASKVSEAGSGASTKSANGAPITRK
ncbi:hypothetical protein ON010_g7192 [Phytophthora cinnamomi]|nr:hypothetical protein ON010_g7192 [Phytophthora cinnamomi]